MTEFTSFSMAAQFGQRAIWNGPPVTDENLDQFLGNGHIVPVHPGIMFRRWVLERLKIEKRAVADAVRIPFEDFDNVLEGRAPVTHEVAIAFARIAQDDPSVWLRSQRIYDLWMARKMKRALPQARP